MLAPPTLHTGAEDEVSVSSAPTGPLITSHLSDDSPLLYLPLIRSFLHPTRQSLPSDPPPLPLTPTVAVAVQLPSLPPAPSPPPLPPTPSSSPRPPSLTPNEWPFSSLLAMLPTTTTPLPLPLSTDPLSLSAPSSLPPLLPAPHPTPTPSNFLRSYLTSPRAAISTCLTFLVSTEADCHTQKLVHYYTHNAVSHVTAGGLRKGLRVQGKVKAGVKGEGVGGDMLTLMGVGKGERPNLPTPHAVQVGGAGVARGGLDAPTPALWLHPAVLSVPLADFLREGGEGSRGGGNFSAEEAKEAEEPLAVSPLVFSSSSARPIDVWFAVSEYVGSLEERARDSGRPVFPLRCDARLKAVVGVSEVSSYSHLSTLLAPHLQPATTPPLNSTSTSTSLLSPSPSSLASLRTATLSTLGIMLHGMGTSGSSPSLTSPSNTSHSLTEPSPTSLSPHSSQPNPDGEGSGATSTGPTSSGVPRPPASSRAISRGLAHSVDGASIRRGFMAANLLSAPLSRLLGHRYLSRPSVVRRLWAYIRSNGLQRATEKRIIDCDPSLAELMNGAQTVSMFEMNQIIGQHLTPIHGDSEDYVVANREATVAEEEEKAEDAMSGRKRQTRRKKKTAAPPAVEAKKGSRSGGRGSGRKEKERERDKGEKSRGKEKKKRRKRKREEAESASAEVGEGGRPAKRSQTERGAATGTAEGVEGVSELDGGQAEGRDEGLETASDADDAEGEGEGEEEGDEGGDDTAEPDGEGNAEENSDEGSDPSEQ